MGGQAGSPSAEAIVSAMERDARGVQLAQSFGWQGARAGGFVAAPAASPGLAGATAWLGSPYGASSPAGPRPQYQPSPPPQTPPVRSKEGKPPTSESTAANLKRLGLDPQQVEMWASRLREWIAQEVLIPLAEKLRTADVRWRLAAQEAAAVAGDNQLLAATSAVQEGARELARATEEDARARTLWDVLTRVAASADAAVATDEQRARDAARSPSPLGGTPGSSLFGGGPGLFGGTASPFGGGANAPEQVAARKRAKELINEARRALLERRKLAAFVRGDWPRGMLPASSTAAYVVARYEALARGHCAAAFQWDGGAVGSDVPYAQRWTPEMPTDSALLLHAVAGWAASRGWEFPLADAFAAAGGNGSRGLMPAQSQALAAALWTGVALAPTGNSGAFHAGTLPNALQAQSNPAQRYTAILAKAPPLGHDTTALVAHRLGDAVNAYYEIRAAGVGTIISLGERGAAWKALALLFRAVLIADPQEGGLGAMSLSTKRVERLFEEYA